MIKVEKALVDPCPFCNGEVELWKYQEIIKCRFICKKCKVEVEFPQGIDSKACIRKWNTKTNLLKPRSDILIPKGTSIQEILNLQYEAEEGDLAETICMDAGPNQFKTVYYKPTCPHGYIDCIRDPAYIKATYPSWYAKLHGGATKPEDISCDKVDYCKNGERYDDEDK